MVFITLALAGAVLLIFSVNGPGRLRISGASINGVRPPR